MGKLKIFVILLLLFFPLFSEDRYLALIGHSDFKEEITNISDKFKDLKYSPLYLIDQDSSNVEGFLDSIDYFITSESRFVLYYIGNSIISEDVSLITNKAGDSLELSWLIEGLLLSKIKNIIIIIDDQNKNPEDSDYRSNLDYYTREIIEEENNKNLYVVHSRGNVGEKSLFTTAFLENISYPNRDLETVMDNVSKDLGLIKFNGKRHVKNKNKIYLNTNEEDPFFIGNEYNTLSNDKFGRLKISASDSCTVLVNNSNPINLGKGHKRSIKLEVGDYNIKLIGARKKEELIVNIRENRNTMLFFTDYNTGLKKEIKKELSAEKKIKVGEYDLDLVLVESGSFKRENKTVNITNDYYIGKFEITQDIYKKVMGKNPSRFNFDKFPVENLTWIDAVTFCNELSLKTGKTPYYVIDGKKVSTDKGGNGFRLPTSAEWEFAAKGGNKSENFKYAGSNSIMDVTEINGKSTMRVGNKLPNELGIYDMSGNVWEWCFDWFQDNYILEGDDPSGPNNGSKKVLRGSGWYDNENVCQISLIGADKIKKKYDSYGLRIVITP